MPDDAPESDAVQETADEITKIRNELGAEIAALKESFESEIKVRDAEIERLTKDNDALHRAVIRSAITTPEPVKTPEQEYADKIADLATRAQQYSEVYR